MRKVLLAKFIGLLQLLILAVISPAQALAEGEESEPLPAGLRTMEYSITIQANVLRICAGGRFYDFIEADYDGDGPSISPYLVETVDAKGQPVSCVAEAEIDPNYVKQEQ